MSHIATNNPICEAQPDPLIDKVLRTAARHIIHYKQSVYGCSLHAVHDKRATFLYAPVPKSACTSICASIADYFRQNDEYALREVPHSIHKYFLNQPRYWIRPTELKNLPHFKFTVVRNPIDRFISGYRNRILDNRDLFAEKLESRARHLPELPDLDFFALHLREYCEASKKVDWHFRPQTTVICSPSGYDRIYDIGELDTLYADIYERCGIELTPHRRNTSRAQAPERLSQRAERALLEFYSGDFEAFGKIITPSTDRS